jgi:hypothetical protein
LATRPSARSCRASRCRPVNGAVRYAGDGAAGRWSPWQRSRLLGGRQKSSRYLTRGMQPVPRATILLATGEQAASRCRTPSRRAGTRFAEPAPSYTADRPERPGSPPGRSAATAGDRVRGPARCTPACGGTRGGLSRLRGFRVCGRLPPFASALLFLKKGRWSRCRLVDVTSCVAPGRGAHFCLGVGRTPSRWELSRLLSSIRGRQAAKAKREPAGTVTSPIVILGAGLNGRRS